MRGKRLKVSMIVAAAAVIAISLWFVQRVRDRHEAAKRESGYQTVLAQYVAELKPGMTREQVERHLQTNGKGFKQMCCVANFKGEYVSFDRAGYDDLVKIAEESVPFVCSENNVYIAFEFNPKSDGEVSHTNLSDILKRVSVFHKLEDCM
jgi:MoaA/NifB/PqqE/SkfB family radical SAM enzyme